MLVKKISAILVLCVAMVAGAQAGGHSGGMGKWMKKLNLSEEQTVQIKALKSEQHLQMKESMGERQAVKQKGLALLDQYSESGAAGLADEAAQLARKTTLARIQNMQKIYAVLNAEQKQKFKKIMAKDHTKGHKRK